MSIAKILIPAAALEFSNKESAELMEQIIKDLVEHDKKQQERLKKLQALESAGVDNWEGYEECMRELHRSEEEDEDE